MAAPCTYCNASKAIINNSNIPIFISIVFQTFTFILAWTFILAKTFVLA